LIGETSETRIYPGALSTLKVADVDDTQVDVIIRYRKAITSTPLLRIKRRFSEKTHTLSASLDRIKHTTRRLELR